MAGMESAGTKGQIERSPRGLNAYLRDVVGDTQEQRAKDLNKGERTIRRWDKQDRDRGKEKAPANPIQEEAWGMCRQGDHGWKTEVDPKIRTGG